MCKIFGVDIGNSDSKTVSESGAFCLKNIISPGRERRLFEEEKGAYADYLDVSIESRGIALGRFFVGDLALREGGQYTREKHMGSMKAGNGDTYVLLLTSVALSLFDPANPVKTEYINLGSGLPTEEFYREGMLEKFKSRVKGTHKVKFNHPVFNDAEITLIVKDVAAIPEGSAAMINQLYDSDGAVIEELTGTYHKM